MISLLGLLFFSLPVWQDDPEVPMVIEGHTMGTTYRIIYFDARHRDFGTSVDSLLHVVNDAISTYDTTSEIARFNSSDKGVCLRLPYFYRILRTARKVNKASGGAFDPTVMPLVNAWGFGPEKSGLPSRRKVDSLRAFTGFDKVRFSKKSVRKSDPHIQLDMGGIGQGFGADVVFEFLRSRGISNLLVELGGEGIAAGKNLQKGRPWQIGILDPNSTQEDQFFKAYVTLGEKAFTTSGNYFNYKVIDGRKYGHTIDPVSGYPVQHSLLSASVFAADCTTADAWATAFMVMGIEKAIDTVKRLRGVDAIFIYSAESGAMKTYVTPGIAQAVTLE